MSLGEPRSPHLNKSRQSYPVCFLHSFQPSAQRSPPLHTRKGSGWTDTIPSFLVAHTTPGNQVHSRLTHCFVPVAGKPSRVCPPQPPPPGTQPCTPELDLGPPVSLLPMSWSPSYIPAPKTGPHHPPIWKTRLKCTALWVAVFQIAGATPRER